MEPTILWDGYEINFDDEWPSAYKPLMVCRDCGCAYGMKNDSCPDFNELLWRGHEVEASEPNEENVTFFSILPDSPKPPETPPKTIPAKVKCPCPFCRVRNRPGYHYKDCTCRICLNRRNECLNRYRYEALAAKKAPKTETDIGHLESGTKVTKNKSQGDAPQDEEEDFVPRNPSTPCPCHIRLPRAWILHYPCPSTLREQQLEGGEGQTNWLTFERNAESHLTKSLSQRQWPEEPGQKPKTGVQYFRRVDTPSDSGIIRTQRPEIFAKTQKQPFCTPPRCGSRSIERTASFLSPGSPGPPNSWTECKKNIKSACKSEIMLSTSRKSSQRSKIPTPDSNKIPEAKRFK